MLGFASLSANLPDRDYSKQTEKLRCRRLVPSVSEAQRLKVTFQGER